MTREQQLRDRFKSIQEKLLRAKSPSKNQSVIVQLTTEEIELLLINVNASLEEMRRK